MNRKGIWGIVLLVLVLGLIYFFFNPTSSHLFPKCPFFVLTDLKCPGCGSQRAIHSLLHLDFVSAFKHNAMLVVSIPLLVVYGYADLNRAKMSWFYNKINNPKLIIGYFLAVVLWMIGRNIFNW